MNTKLLALSEKTNNISHLNKITIIERLKPVVKAASAVLYIHCLGFNQFADYAEFLPFINGLEIKPEKFKGKDALFYWEGDVLKYNPQVFSRLKQLLDLHQLKIQFHFPLRDIQGRVLDTANPKDHEALLQVFGAYAAAINDFNPGGKVNITVHPPKIADHSNEEQIKNALVNANVFYRRLGEQIEQENWPVIIGIENQPPPNINNYKIDELGYLIFHFDILLAGTNNRIQITVDSGHCMLSVPHKNGDKFYYKHPADEASELSELVTIDRIVEWCRANGKYITNFHFHENNGIDLTVIANGKSCDTHAFPTPEHIPGYMRYLERAVLENVPLNLEIDSRKYKPSELAASIQEIRTKIDELWLALSSQPDRG
ncbi:MAG: hypothetical protein A2X42_06365 [Candidatus Margulisbacteria bacterium GWF2_38_17]|nr:MAG: hypothetical protein A2X42_06365 [Candidatus Margulisbacteria bacterium GWF2_38_17]